MYIFSEDSRVNDKILASTESGGVGINIALEHVSYPSLPFGGVGESGMGAYHGKWGFDEFSHKRSVLYKDTSFLQKGVIEAIPCAAPAWMYDVAVKFHVIGLFTPFQQRMLVRALGVAV